AIEMCGVDRQHHMFRHRRAVIAAAHERHRRPERAHLSEVWLPIADPGVEHRRQQCVAAHLGVEAAYQALDHRLGDPGSFHDAGGDRLAPFGGEHDKVSKIGISNTYLACYGQAAKSHLREAPMRLTTFTDFALRALMRLAGEPDRSFSTSEIAAEFRLSRNHLTKVVRDLAEGGFVAQQRR